MANLQDPAVDAAAGREMLGNFTIEPYDKDKTKWARWVKRLEGAFRIFNVPEERMKDFLLYYMGSSAYDLLCDHITPAEPEEKTYQQLVTILTAFFDPEPLEMVEVWRFRSLNQSEGESITEFITTLKREAKFCKFENYLAKELRNQLVFGIRSERIRARLIEERELTFERAKDIAISMEVSGEGARALEKKVHSVNYTEQKAFHRGLGNKVTNKANTKYCYRCGDENHLASTCKYVDAICKYCGNKGHLYKVCLKKELNNKSSRIRKEKSKLHTNMIEKEDDKDLSSESGESDIDEVCVLDICTVNQKSKSLSKILLKLNTNRVVIEYEVDCGSPVSVMSLSDKKTFLTDLKLHPTNIELRSYCGNRIEVYGFVNVEVQYQNIISYLRLFIVDTKRHPLLGREWMREIQIDWNKLIRNSYFSVDTISLRVPLAGDVKNLIERFPNVFADSVGTIRNIQASLALKPNSNPVFLKARTLPFSIRDTVELEIRNMVKNGILVKVNRSSWATPVVPVVKSAGRVRLCGDYKVTVNKCLHVDEHPLPTIDELFANMAGGKKFTKLDLAQAYLQMEVREEDRELLTLNTHLGLFQPTRLMYGISSAPAIFQREISQVLGNLPGVSVFLDDIKITGPDDVTHLKRLETVLRILDEYNMRVNVSKCDFFADRIEYCGFVIDRDGIRKMKNKVDAIQEMPRPNNRDQVRAYVGLINYYGRFIKDLSTHIYPINNLLKENVSFHWDDKCETAFQWVKREMQSDNVLVHYDPKLPLVLATDASPYGVGAVLSHQFPDGTERPIQYASQTLNKTQQNYMQLDKEAYAIIFGVKKFYQYLYGRKFILVTDNKPVSQILAPNKGLPTLSALRMQHYAVFMESFDYEIRYRTSKANANADGMSRLPIVDTRNKNRVEEVDIVEINQIETLPVTVDELAECTREDGNVRNLLQGLKFGRIIEGRDRFGINQNEFSLQKGCILKGIRVYIPPKLRKRILDELHMGHFGISRMKSLARSYCWWETVDRDIEDVSKNCTDCAYVRKNPPKVTTHSWENPKEPFHRVHIDFAGPFLGLYFLVIVDAFTKWPDVKIVPDITTDTTIDHLREYFVTYGVPSVIVSDRGVQFTSEQFQTFLKKNGVTHKMGAPYHPATNGQAERFVQTFKDKLKTLKCERKTVRVELHKILMAYRRTVHPATGKSPSMLVFGRQMKSQLDLIIPSGGNDFSRGEEGEVREFAINDRVSARDYLGSSKWKFGTVSERLGKLHYMIELDDGRLWKRHIDQLRLAPVRQASESDLDPINVEIYNRNRCIDAIPPLPSQALTRQTRDDSEDGVDITVTTDANFEDRMRSSHQIAETPIVNKDNSNNDSAIEMDRKCDTVIVDKRFTPRRSTRVVRPPQKLDL